MKARLARLGVITAAVLGLFASMTPPASATTVGVATFTGTAIVNPGLGYPCAPVGTTGPKCPPSVMTTSKAGPQTAVVTNVTFGGNAPSAFTFQSTVCMYVGVNINKLAKSPVDAGTCSVTAAGTVQGYCGASSGKGTGRVTGPIGGVGTAQTITVTFAFTSVGDTLVITGTATKNGRGGPLAGVADSLAFPQMTGTTITNSCASKSASQFTINGAIVAAIQT